MDFRLRMVLWIPTLAYAAFLIIGWQKLGFVRPGCLCNVSRGFVGISSSDHVQYQATSARETQFSFEPLAP